MDWYSTVYSSIVIVAMWFFSRWSVFKSRTPSPQTYQRGTVLFPPLPQGGGLNLSIKTPRGTGGMFLFSF